MNDFKQKVRVINLWLKKEEVVSRIFVKLSTSYWSDSRGLNMKRSIIFLKRKCRGHNYLEEDVKMVGADLVFKRILNLNQCEDGVYQIIMCDGVKDYETGIIEDWNYKLDKV